LERRGESNWRKEFFGRDFSGNVTEEFFVHEAKGVGGNEATSAAPACISAIKWVKVTEGARRRNVPACVHANFLETIRRFRAVHE